MRKLLLWMITALLAVGAMTSHEVLGAEPVPVQVKAKVKKSYQLGLPLRVTVEVTNTSPQTVETLLPSSKLETIGATIQREGAKELLIPTIHRHSLERRKTIQLKPGGMWRVQLDLSMMFLDDLPPGRYVCQVYYNSARSVRSEPVLVIIEEPKAATDDEQRDLRLSMTMFLAARVLLSENNEPSLDAAYRLLSYIMAYRRDLEYGRVSAFYKARLEQDPKAALSAWLDYMEAPATDAPEMMEQDDIRRIIGRLYYETNNLKAAKETFLKIAEPDTIVQEYLQKIEKRINP